MQQSDTLSEFRDHAQKGLHRSNIISDVLTVVLLVALVWGGVSWWQGRITIRNARVVGESAVCAGDRLIVAYDFHAQSAGLLDVDSSLWSIDPPPRTIVYSASRRFVLSEGIDQQITEAWQVPESYTDFATGDETPLAPGRYRRDIAISSPTRSWVLATASVEFVVRSDCKKGASMNDSLVGRIAKWGGK